ncbi:MAG: c-type cytochrome [Bacteroidetes bacterium]|nr:c-type cytochrome [Bacteroidota bacterium]
MKGSVFTSKVTSVCLIFFALIFFSVKNVHAQPDGASLFKAQCAQCHSVGSNKVIGPGLKDVHTRRNEEWLLKWTKNSQGVIKSGDAYAVKLYNEYNQTAMPSFALSDDEIKSIFAYIKAEGEKVAAAPAPGAAGAAGAKAEEPGFPWMLTMIFVILGVLYLVLGKVKEGLERALRSKQGLPEPIPVTSKQASKNWIRGNKKLIAVMFVIFAVWGSVKGWNALAGIGISQNYAPEQPIKFSHKLHVGQNGISCVYCHSGAEKSRHANIPSPNVCMNCHKYVQQGPTYGTTEIAKIYAALDYDPNTQKYGTNPKPIKWVQIHNLPDLAYFNHAQHVTVGQIECQTCHGPVEEMEVVKQFSPLTMGWCIDCHRTTEVKMEGNAYYTELHDKLKKQYGPEAKLTVDKIGGLECARCHY